MWNTITTDEFVPALVVPPGVRVAVNIGQRPFEVAGAGSTTSLQAAAGMVRSVDVWLRRTGAHCGECTTGKVIYGLAFRCLECAHVYLCGQHAAAHGHCMVALSADAVEDWSCDILSIIPHLDLSGMLFTLSFNSPILFILHMVFVVFCFFHFLFVFFFLTPLYFFSQH